MSLKNKLTEEEAKELLDNTIFLLEKETKIWGDNIYKYSICKEKSLSNWIEKGFVEEGKLEKARRYCNNFYNNRHEFNIMTSPETAVSIAQKYYEDVIKELQDKLSKKE